MEISLRLNKKLNFRGITEDERRNENVEKVC